MKITHATDTEIVKLSDLADGTTVAACGDCRSLLKVTKDESGFCVECECEYVESGGFCVECECDCGYVDDKTIRAIVMW